MSKTVKLGMDTLKMYYDKEIEPAAYIDSGDTVICESEDANFSHFLTEDDIQVKFSDLRKECDGSDPVCGPIYVNGAKAGDFLAVEILDVEPGPWRNNGYTAIQGGCGWLEMCNFSLQKPLTPSTRILDFDGEGSARLHLAGSDEFLKVPLDAFVGCIGVAPSLERRSSDSPNEEYCGNVDIELFKKGYTVILRCNVDGGLLSMGDVHAVQGDGEITGCAIECQGRTTARVSLIKKEDMPYYGCPQVNSDKILGSVGVWPSKNLSFAIMRAYSDLIHRLEAEYGISEADGYVLMSVAGKVRIGNGSSAVCYIDKDCLVKHKKD